MISKKSGKWFVTSKSRFKVSLGRLTFACDKGWSSFQFLIFYLFKHVVKAMSSLRLIFDKIGSLINETVNKTLSSFFVQLLNISLVFIYFFFWFFSTLQNLINLNKNKSTGMKSLWLFLVLFLVIKVSVYFLLI